MLKIIRIIIAGIVFILCTLLFLDFTGLASRWFGWLAKIQFLPAALALNEVVVIALLLLTLVFGRVYCSVICPMGIFQDVVAHSFKGWRKRHKKHFGWSPEKKWLRYGMLAVFIIAMILGANALVALFAPYSSYGRIAQNLFSPIWLWGNNLCSWIAEKAGGYAFEHKDVWIRSIPTFIIASVTFIVIVILAARNGRTYCNTICPVGTVLSFFSRFAIFRPVIDTSKCKTCHLCERNCKAACIDLNKHKVDYSRCVACFDCIDTCKFGAMKYRLFWENRNDDSDKVNADRTAKDVSSIPTDSAGTDDNGRRAFIATSALTLGTLTVKAQEKKEGSGEDSAAGAIRRIECQGVLPALYRLPALCLAVPERGAEAFVFTGASDAAGDVLRARLVPCGVQQVLTGMPVRPYTAIRHRSEDDNAHRYGSRGSGPLRGEP